MHRALIRVGAVTAAVLFIFVTGSRLLAPGPPDFYIEPTTGMVLTAIQPGTFVMGSPENEPGRQADETPHRVTISRRFYIGRFEVTQSEWQRVMGSNPSRFTNCARCPVEQVTFYDVASFLSRLTAQSTAIRFRLPTEAEWEYSCRAGAATAYGLGDTLQDASANINTQPDLPWSPASDARRTRHVGGYPPNRWSLFDMHGNVWEWTNDFAGPYDPAQDVDPKGPAAGLTRIIRGGSWYFDAASARCAQRYTHAPQDKGFSLGFRVVGEPIVESRIAR
jgi:formylglycine-generating enzyme required for sulfatase activity